MLQFCHAIHVILFTHQGWSNRPQPQVVTKDIVTKDIAEFALRKTHAKHYHDFGLTQRSEPHAWKDNVVVARNATHQSKKADVMGSATDFTPGPKYELPGSMDGHKCAPFSQAQRFGNGKTTSRFNIYIHNTYECT